MSPPSHNLSPDSSAIDELFELLSNESHRRVLYYLREHDGTAEVEELRAHLSERTKFDPDEVSTILYHVVLPKLDDSGVIDYDSDSEQVRYVGSPLTTGLLEWIGDRERTKN